MCGLMNRCMHMYVAIRGHLSAYIQGHHLLYFWDRFLISLELSH